MSCKYDILTQAAKATIVKQQGIQQKILSRVMYIMCVPLLLSAAARGQNLASSASGSLPVVPSVEATNQAAQEPGQASQIRGQVLDISGRPLAGAQVQLLNPEGLVVGELVASQEGTFLFDRMDAGEYVLTARSGNRVSPRVVVRHTSAQASEIALPFRTIIVPNRRESAGSSTDGEGAAALDREIVEMRRQLAEMQKRLEELAAARGGVTNERPAVAATDPGTVAAAAPGPPRPEPSLASLAAPAQRAEPGQQEATALEPGSSDKGLYGGLAAGAPGERYGRSIFSDRVKIGGYGSFRFESNNIDLGPQVGDLPRLKRGFSSFDFRRFVITLDAAPSERLRFYSEIEFERLNKLEVERNAIPENRGRVTRDRRGVRFIQEVEGQSGGEIAVEQAWAQYDFTKKFGLRMGVILPPVGRFNILHDDDYWDLPRRTLVDRGGPVLPVKGAWRELGAGFVGNIPIGKGYLDYQAYVVNGAQLDFTLEQVVALREGRNLLEAEPEISFASGAFNGTNTANALTWRIAASPSLGHEFAFSGYHGEYTPDYLNQDAYINTVAFDGKTTLGSFEVEGEFVYTDFGRLRAVVDDLALQMVDAAASTSSSETATLETEIEAEFAGPLTNQRYGFWVDFKYRFWPKWMDNTFFGRDLENPQLIPIFRFERIWFNNLVNSFNFSESAITSLNAENLQQQRTSLGLAYRPITSVVFSAAWEHNRRISGSQLIFPRLVGVDPLRDKSFDAVIFGTAFGF